MSGAYVLERRQKIPADLGRVFAFFKDPYNLEAITPPWLRFHVVEASDSTVRAGTTIRYVLRWHMTTMRWESVIAEFRENERFADEMRRGPYKRWYHTHVFVGNGAGVEMRDRVEYELPFGPLGRLVHALVVRRQLEAIFDYRENRIAEIFANE